MDCNEEGARSLGRTSTRQARSCDALARVWEARLPPLTLFLRCRASFAQGSSVLGNILLVAFPFSVDRKESAFFLERLGYRPESKQGERHGCE
ncbi:hypothetical protein EI42_05883 [Thermosporothrix hazakensis]|uniref:Uncharacterized protein n=1 Tax=Thermosporothrix hazakensis TaxID=644383 RepID=A0A326U501_THEHA|nr:hypothetical protein EI42_05883 [Thermosporothrix hazakensis]